MPSMEEYVQIFRGIIESAPPIVTGTDREMIHIGGVVKKNLVKQKGQFTLGISNLWRQRFKEIKEENDMLQKALKDAYKDAIEFTEARYEPE